MNFEYCVLLVPPIVDHTSASRRWGDLLAEATILALQVNLFANQPVNTRFPYPLTLVLPSFKPEKQRQKFVRQLNMETMLQTLNAARRQMDEALGQPKILIISWSLGTMAALKYAQHEKRVEGVIGISPVLTSPDPQWQQAVSVNDLHTKTLLIGGQSDSQVTNTCSTIAAWQRAKPEIVEAHQLMADHAFDTKRLRPWFPFNPMYNRRAAEESERVIWQWLQRHFAITPPQ